MASYFFLNIFLFYVQNAENGSFFTLSRGLGFLLEYCCGGSAEGMDGEKGTGRRGRGTMGGDGKDKEVKEREEKEKGKRKRRFWKVKEGEGEW